MRFTGSVVFFALLICLQTTVFSNLSGAFPLYDLLIPAVVYLTLFRPYKTELPAIMVAGVIMDLLSEAPMGFYLITYSAILLVFQKSKKYLHVKNMGLFQIVSIIGILMEYCVFSVFTSIQAMTVDVPFHAIQTLLIQVVWAAVTLPFIYLILNYGFKGFDQMIITGFRPTV
ncbi:MAG: rod shape-determining protein MreD [Desulfosalsimonadaceae bacterium]